MVRILRQDGIKISSKRQIQIINVMYSGDEGGIMCALKGTGDDKTAVLVSLTHLRLPTDHPLARIIHKIAVSSCKSLFYNRNARNAYCNKKKETTMAQDTQIVLPFARLSGKNLQADFDGGALSSDGGVLFLREIEAQVGVIAAWRERSMTRAMRVTPSIVMRNC